MGEILARGEISSSFMVILSCRPIQVSVSCRSFGEDNGMDFWSDDEDNEKMSRSWSSTSDESLFNCDVLWSNRKRPGHLYFEFFEVGSPYGRVPLIDKVNFFGLCCDLISTVVWIASLT
jgi:hypothetical protein